jgi:hypothetical protein
MGKPANLLRQQIWTKKNPVMTTIFMLGEFLHIGNIKIWKYMEFFFLSCKFKKKKNQEMENLPIFWNNRFGKKKLVIISILFLG